MTGASNRARGPRASPITPERLDRVTPRGCILAQCKPLSVALWQYPSATLTGDELARHAGLALPSETPPSMSQPRLGELAGFIALSTVFASAMVSGHSMPDLTRLYSWNLAAVPLTAWDEVAISAVRDGHLTAWPFVVEEELRPRYRMREDGLLEPFACCTVAE